MGRFDSEVKPVTKWDARVYFLKAIEDVTPEVLSDLQNKVMPSLMNLEHFKSLCENDERYSMPLSWQEYPEEIKTIFADWAEKHNLLDNCNWVIETASQSVLMWTMKPETLGEWVYEPSTDWDDDDFDLKIIPDESDSDDSEFLADDSDDEQTDDTDLKESDDNWTKTDSEIRNDEQYEWLALRVVRNYKAEQISDWRNELNRSEYLGDIKTNIIYGYKHAAKKVGIKSV